jgi:hypothetical protein
LACREKSRRSRITPFILTPDAAKGLFKKLPLRIVSQTVDIEQTKRDVKTIAPRHMGDRLKRLFYKNATIEVIAIRQD